MSGDFSMFIKHQDCSKCKTVLLALTNPASIPPAFNVPPPQVFQNNYSSPPTILKKAAVAETATQKTIATKGW